MTTARADVTVPAPGASPRIDAIKKSGVLRVGVLANAPWLVENTSGQGEAWSGPAWLLAQEYAKRRSRYSGRRKRASCAAKWKRAVLINRVRDLLCGRP